MDTLRDRFAISNGKLDRLLDKSEILDINSREAKVAAEKARDAATSVTRHVIFVALTTVGVGLLLMLKALGRL